MINQNLKIFTATIFVFCFIIFGLQSASAQTAVQFLTSWQAYNYAPSWYQGKVFPTKGTSVEIGFELLDKGKIADLSETKVRWYVNERLAANEDDGLGLKNLKITVPDYPGHETNVRIAIVNYLGGDTLYKNIAIPIVSPEAIIESPCVGGKIGFGESVFKAIPFFFNVEDTGELLIEWSSEQEVKDQSAESWFLGLNIEPTTPSGATINLSAKIKNILNELEFAVKSFQVQVK